MNPIRVLCTYSTSPEGRQAYLTGVINSEKSVVKWYDNNTKNDSRDESR